MFDYKENRTTQLLRDIAHNVGGWMDLDALSHLSLGKSRFCQKTQISSLHFLHFGPHWCVVSHDTVLVCASVCEHFQLHIEKCTGTCGKERHTNPSLVLASRTHTSVCVCACVHISVH